MLEFLERAFLQRIFFFVIDTFHLTVSFNNNVQFSKSVLFIQAKKQNLKEIVVFFVKSKCNHLQLVLL